MTSALDLSKSTHAKVAVLHVAVNDVVSKTGSADEVGLMAASL
jgi:hypothetical protein